MTGTFHARRAILTAVATATVALVVGCSSTAPAPGTSNADSFAADPTGTFTYAYSTDGGQNYDPVTAANQYVGFFLWPVYDRLFDINASGELIPMLGELTSVSEDGLELAITLRDDVLFHDGTELTADVVKANLERGQSGERSTLTADLAAIAEIEVISDTELVLRLARPDAALPYILADRAGMIVSGEALGAPDLDLAPVGAGPYRVTEVIPGSSVTYEKFEDYYALDPDAAGTLDVQVVLDGESRLSGLRSGQTDAATLVMDQTAAAETAGVTVEFPDSPAMPFLLYLNMSRNPALADPQVRAALSLAIDRAGISQAILGGNCAPSVQLFREGFWAASTDIPESAIEQDVEGARELLAEAGYPDGFSMTLSAIGASPFRAVAEALASQFAEIGVDVELQVGEPVKVVGDFTTQKLTDGYTSMWAGSFDPSKTVSSLLLPGGLFNPGGLDTPEITELAAAGLVESDPDRRAEIYQELSTVAYDQHVQIPICSAVLPYGYNDTVNAIGATPSGLPDLRNVQVSAE